ncbi:nitrate ABC transporter permease [Aquimarina agarilytica]|uniref:nitrate ABC transporter permease n=1 Tax=Aquimarina agarilytica TaxID=1087449 RepID=UPI0002893EDB|nr:nitrate ABC transporter permease [Aquimarina agarilytica]
MSRENIQTITLSLLILFLIFFIGELATTNGERNKKELSEYEQLMGLGEPQAHVPGPIEVLKLAVKELSHPFYDNGPNDKGIGTQLFYSILRVLAGYLLAVVIAIPIGFLIGMSPVFYNALQPYIQVLKPISPLAWMPLALFVIKDSILSSVFVIFICSIWPILLNTAFGVMSVKKDWLNVSKTLEMGPFETAFKIILPAALPTIFTGLRISMGISWLVIVAAEMLVGGTGIGYYVWNEWNNLDLTSVVFSILMIGIVGMGLDLLISQTSKYFMYQE